MDEQYKTVEEALKSFAVSQLFIMVHGVDVRFVAQELWPAGSQHASVVSYSQLVYWLRPCI
jgi:hypothetical protein